MKIIIIKITVPKEGDKWKVSMGQGQPRRKKNAVEVYGHVERFLSRKLCTSSASNNKGEIELLIKDGSILDDKQMETINEGEYEGKKEALYVLACFLEDYLPMRYQDKKYKLYGEEII